MITHLENRAVDVLPATLTCSGDSRVASFDEMLEWASATRAGLLNGLHRAGAILQ